MSVIRSAVALMLIGTLAVHAQAAVDGYWLNVPGKSPYCPNCGVPRGDIGAQFLNLYRHWLDAHR